MVQPDVELQVGRKQQHEKALGIGSEFVDTVQDPENNSLDGEDTSSDGGIISTAGERYRRSESRLNSSNSSNTAVLSLKFLN